MAFGAAALATITVKTVNTGSDSFRQKKTAKLMRKTNDGI